MDDARSTRGAPERIGASGAREALEQLCLRGMATAVDAQAIERREAERLREERRERMIRRRDLLDASHVPLDDDARRRVIREEYADRPAILAVREAIGLARPTRYLVLAGGYDARRSVGTGKTTAAAHALVSLGGGLYLESAELATLARSTRWEDRERLRLAQEVDCLVIDEIGIEADRAARAARDAALFAAINRRQSKPKLTILISNKAGRELLASLDPRVRSRMAPSMRVIDCTGEDMRRAG